MAHDDRYGHQYYALFNPNSRQTGFWGPRPGTWFYGSAYGPTLPSGWELVAAADFNWDGHPDYVLYNPATRQTAVWYLYNDVQTFYSGGNSFFYSGAYGPTLPAGWGIAGVADFDGDGSMDCALFNPSTGQTFDCVFKKGQR